jgi:hypothetical protein
LGGEPHTPASLHPKTRRKSIKIRFLLSRYAPDSLISAF